MDILGHHHELEATKVGPQAQNPLTWPRSNARFDFTDSFARLGDVVAEARTGREGVRL